MCTRPNYIRYNDVLGTRTQSKTLKPTQFVPHVNFDKMLEQSILEGFEFIPIPCGQCLECRSSHAQQWADRCTLEASKYKDNFFITLTYDENHLPKNESLVREDIQNFVKYLRTTTDNKIKVFYSGEYGDTSLRPHYHLILFNYPIDDLSYEFKEAYGHVYRDNGWLDSVQLRAHLRPLSDNELMYSETIHKAWQYKGNISVGFFTYATACYVAQYVVKKAGGKDNKFYTSKGLLPEFIGMSKGLGSNGYSKSLFVRDIVYENSFNAYGVWTQKKSVELQKQKLIVPANGKARIVSRLPRYFEKLFEKQFPDLFLKYIKAKSVENKAKTKQSLTYGMNQQQLDIRAYMSEKKIMNSRNKI